MKEREIIEEEKRNAYTFAKDQREQAYKDEQERIRKEKEAAADLIRKAQESASGAADALEDLRNQRIFVRFSKIHTRICECFEYFKCLPILIKKLNTSFV